MPLFLKEVTVNGFLLWEEDYRGKNDVQYLESSNCRDSDHTSLRPGFGTETLLVSLVDNLLLIVNEVSVLMLSDQLF